MLLRLLDNNVINGNDGNTIYSSFISWIFPRLTDRFHEYHWVDRPTCDRQDQSCKKITILDRKDRDLFIDLDLLHDLNQFIDLLKLTLIFDLQSPKLEIIL